MFFFDLSRRAALYPESLKSKEPENAKRAIEDYMKLPRADLVDPVPPTKQGVPMKDEYWSRVDWVKGEQNSVAGHY